MDYTVYCAALVAAGGAAGGQALDTVHAFHPATGTSCTLPSLPVTRAYLTLDYLTGYGLGTPLKLVLEYLVFFL